MATPRRRSAARRGKLREEVKFHCSECARSYDPHSKALDGHLILCRCPLKGKGGRFCIFLNDPACEQFIPKET